jgi:hypothetical protein
MMPLIFIPVQYWYIILSVILYNFNLYMFLWLIVSLEIEEQKVSLNSVYHSAKGL